VQVGNAELILASAPTFPGACPSDYIGLKILAFYDLRSRAGNGLESCATRPQSSCNFRIAGDTSGTRKSRCFQCSMSDCERGCPPARAFPPPRSRPALKDSLRDSGKMKPAGASGDCVAHQAVFSLQGRATRHRLLLAQLWGAEPAGYHHTRPMDSAPKAFWEKIMGAGPPLQPLQLVAAGDNLMTCSAREPSHCVP
jgi:hypothetical protein